MLRTTLLQTRLSARSLSHAALLREQEYDYTRISNLIRSPSPSQKLIDVREPHEFAAGHIPTSINLPLSTLEATLSLPASEFRRRLGVEKPAVEEEVVFYCKAGVRSTSASRIAERQGYRAVGNYRGSWTDYASRRDAGDGGGGGKRAFSTARLTADDDKAPNPNVQDGTGQGAPGGIDLKKMNQGEEKRAEADKAREKEDGNLAGAKEEESESVRSGAELSGNKKFE
ncbi:protein of unknown function [Taphrina deformans PYCC 5710]|uniref:Rhodanese domain-containing protein n=1 Tax=Taphrina deformans (strain PYCC 5710 / ATCC 11124 / CBS 356.35 / IMI 108563 / JCM 9778 / NBRC 8474) TaxID=1097556 RepID=R4XE25_TAPDE|nr:protein of unknown function [Taphrina deformans PYCC 5710]|eukprot:CCG83917.1 protein of unknown function [Taphrina deformans PYCC 5710]